MNQDGYNYTPAAPAGSPNNPGSSPAAPAADSLATSSPLGAPLAPETQATSPLGAPLGAPAQPAAPQAPAAQPVPTPPAAPAYQPPAAQPSPTPPAAPAYQPPAAQPSPTPPAAPAYQPPAAQPSPTPPAAPAYQPPAAQPSPTPPAAPAYQPPAAQPSPTQPAAPAPSAGAAPQAPSGYPGPSSPGAPAATPPYGGTPGAQPGAYGTPGAQPGAYGAPPRPGMPPPKKKKKKNTGLIVVLVILIVAGLGVGGFFFYTSMQKDKLAEAYTGGDYSTVVATYEGTSWIQKDFQNEYDYSRARLLLTDGKSEEALDILDKLGGFADSTELANQTRYDMAMDLLDSGDLKASLELFKELGRYEDSASYVTNIEQYLYADGLEDGMERYFAFEALGDFLDSAERARESVGPVYDEAVALYMSGDLDGALSRFYEISDVLESNLYIEAIELAQEGMSFRSTRDNIGRLRDIMARLMDLSRTIDVSHLVMRGNLFTPFLEGVWTTSSGEEFVFSVDSGYGFSYEEVTGNYYFLGTDDGSSGIMLPEYLDKPIVTFTLIDLNTITIQIGDGAERTFYRS